MSLIEEQLSRLKKEAEERAAQRAYQSAGARTAAPRGAPARAETTAGVLEIEASRMAELLPHSTTVQSVTEALAGFDFNQGALQSFLEILMMAGVGLRASDIHCEPEEQSVRMRYRIDGLLYDAGVLPQSFYHGIVSRLKLLGRMKLNADRPHDGRFTVRMPAKDIEVRASSTPTHYGEALVLRILNPESIAIPLEELGLRPDDLAIVMEEIAAPNGMILNTGPTGSGKTTTLYAFLQKRARPELKIITIEDPIEYQLPGIEQTQVSPEDGYTFANGLRSIVRQDPDIMLVGEIRDEETAGIAIEAALTGHLVFSTVHANSAAGAIPRLLNMKIVATSIGPAINVIMAQRLVRRLCDACKKPKEMPADKAEQLRAYIAALPSRVRTDDFRAIQLCDAVGCGACGNHGYRGRSGVFELLRVDGDIERLIEQRASETDLERFAVARGMVTMQQDGMVKALYGITTIEEVATATGKLPF